MSEELQQKVARFNELAVELNGAGEKRKPKIEQLQKYEGEMKAMSREGTAMSTKLDATKAQLDDTQALAASIHEELTAMDADLMPKQEEAIKLKPEIEEEVKKGVDTEEQKQALGKKIARFNALAAELGAAGEKRGPKLAQLKAHEAEMQGLSEQGTALSKQLVEIETRVVLALRPIPI